MSNRLFLQVRKTFHSRLIQYFRETFEFTCSVIKDDLVSIENSIEDVFVKKLSESFLSRHLDRMFLVSREFQTLNLMYSYLKKELMSTAEDRTFRISVYPSSLTTMVGDQMISLSIDYEHFQGQSRSSKRFDPKLFTHVISIVLLTRTQKTQSSRSAEHQKHQKWEELVENDRIIEQTRMEKNSEFLENLHCFVGICEKEYWFSRKPLGTPSENHKTLWIKKKITNPTDNISAQCTSFQKDTQILDLVTRKKIDYPYTIQEKTEGFYLANELNNFIQWRMGDGEHEHQMTTTVNVSRARFKLSESLRRFPIRIFSGLRAIDIGAAPGGITSEFATLLLREALNIHSIGAQIDREQRKDHDGGGNENNNNSRSNSFNNLRGSSSSGSCTVITSGDSIPSLDDRCFPNGLIVAIDPATMQLPSYLSSLVIHFQMKAELAVHYLWKVEPFDVMVCDANVLPRIAMDILELYLPLLKSGGHLLWTIKRFRTNFHTEEILTEFEKRFCNWILPSSDDSSFAVKWLFSNHNERTLFATKK